MSTVTQIAENQKRILRELEQLKARVAALGSLGRFEELARRGRQFAKEKGIAKKDVLRYNESGSR